MATFGFVREYLNPRSPRIEAREISYRRAGRLLPARVYRIGGRDRPGPAWVLLHGLTFHGRTHPALDRFARALAASGATVFVPEIPEWSELRVKPAATGPSIEGAIDTLIDERLAHADRIGVFGFSFGATQALAALADPRLGERVRALVAWGGYCDLHRLFRFGITGEHELDGIRERVDPDPYGAWIMGANYLTGIPGYERFADLGAALGELARESGRRGIYARDPVYDTLKVQLQEGLPPAQREVFRVFAPVTGQPPADPAEIEELIRELAAAALRADPLLDPQPLIPNLRVRTVIAHGRDDRLIPYTESLRLGRALPEGASGRCVITSLFAHSTGAGAGLSRWARARETFRFLSLLHQILRLA
jgi:pimeloyl-ACP methyl ester carboxylesterase